MSSSNTYDDTYEVMVEGLVILSKHFIVNSTGPIVLS